MEGKEIDTYDAELVLDAKAQLGEGAIWDEEQQVLYWVDIFGQSLHVYNPTTQEDKVHSFEDQVCTVVRVKCHASKLLIALASKLIFFDTITGESEDLKGTEAPANCRFNDGKCDNQGRFYVGTMARDEENGGQIGALYLLHKQDVAWKLIKIFGPTSVSNGIVWSPTPVSLVDHMIFIDSPVKAVYCFSRNVTTGTIIKDDAPELICHQPSDSDGYPDGCTLDADGNLYVACWEGHEVLCWQLKQGGLSAASASSSSSSASLTPTLIRRIRVPVSRVTSVAFGGPDMSTLFITTAKKGASDDELADEPLSGSLFSVQIPGIRGVPAAKFSMQE